MLPAPSGHYPGRIFPVKRMLPVKAILVAAPLLLGGALAFAFVRVAQRIGAEVEEGRRLAGVRPAGGAGSSAPKEPTAP